MEDRYTSSPWLRVTRYSNVHTAAAIILSLAAIGSSFLLAASDIDGTSKTYGFVGIVLAFLAIRISAHFWERSVTRFLNDDADNAGSEIERQLAALDDANEFFAGSLRTADMFRLVASRVNQLIPFRTISLHLLDEDWQNFQVVESQGPDAEHHIGKKIGSTEGLPGKCYLSQVIELEAGTSWHRPAIAIPLSKGTDVFAILEMEFEMGFDLSGLDTYLLDAVGTRCTPPIQSSLSYERSQANALTDSTTEIPNERAFHLVLENQVAESSRKGSSRPLTILALDIRSFDEINNGFGHAAADRVLNFVARNIRNNLREMDFLARSNADEFLATLPTASTDIAQEVIGRIQTGFFARRFQVTENETVEIELNIGWATLGSDGETPETLLAVARERKEQLKSAVPSSVLWFPRELPN